MKVKGCFAIFLAIVLTVAPWPVHAEEPQPSSVSNGAGAGSDDDEVGIDDRAIAEFDPGHPLGPGEAADARTAAKRHAVPGMHVGQQRPHLDADR